jgi:long-chain acyl-CoA synthetase
MTSKMFTPELFRPVVDYPDIPYDWKAPEETAHTLRNGWIHTGDIGHVNADGYLYIVDRKKDMIKYKGFSIAPAELEAVLVEHPAVLESAVVGVPDEEAGEIPKAFVVLHGDCFD